MKEKKRKVLDLFKDAAPLPAPEPADPSARPVHCPGITVNGNSNTLVLLLSHHPTDLAAPLPSCSRSLSRD